MRYTFAWSLVIVLIGFGALVLLFVLNPSAAAEVTVVHETDTRKSEMYETPTEKLVTLSDGRKLVCLQASYGALWCTPALERAGS